MSNSDRRKSDRLGLGSSSCRRHSTMHGPCRRQSSPLGSRQCNHAADHAGDGFQTPRANRPNRESRVLKAADVSVDLLAARGGMVGFGELVGECRLLRRRRCRIAASRRAGRREWRSRRSLVVTSGAARKRAVFLRCDFRGAVASTTRKMKPARTELPADYSICSPPA